jgi:hypothetical protein
MGDNDPARFWRHAVVAPDRVRPRIGERVGPLLGPPPSLCEVLLVLDDYHLIDVEPVHTTVNCLLESAARRAPGAEQPASTRRCRWRGCGSARPPAPGSSTSRPSPTTTPAPDWTPSPPPKTNCRHSPPSYSPLPVITKSAEHNLEAAAPAAQRMPDGNRARRAVMHPLCPRTDRYQAEARIGDPAYKATAFRARTVVFAAHRLTSDIRLIGRQLGRQLDCLNCVRNGRFCAARLSWPPVPARS